MDAQEGAPPPAPREMDMVCSVPVIQPTRCCPAQNHAEI